MDPYVFRQRAINAPATASTAVEILGRNLGTPIIMSVMTMPIPAITDNGLKKVAREVMGALAGHVLAFFNSGFQGRTDVLKALAMAATLVTPRRAWSHPYA